MTPNAGERFMKKRWQISAALLAALLLFGGCENATRDLDSQVARGSDNSGSAGSINTPDQNGTVSMQPPAGGSVTDENSTVGEIKVDAKNAYRVAVTFSENYKSKGYFSREEIGQVHFDITNLYTGAPADVSKIEQITLEASDKNSPSDGKYFNFITFDGSEGPVYTIPKTSIKASDDVALKVKDLSGTTDIIFKATVQLGDGTTSDYTLTVPMVIEKNRSSSMAIVPIDTRYENGLFIDKFVIHVADSYGNKPKDGTYISTGVINNPKLYSQALKEGQAIDENVLYDIISNDNHTYFKTDKGALKRSDATFTLPANSIDMTHDSISPLDTLIVLANKSEHKPENLGGWDIKSVDDDHTLSLVSVDGTNDVSGVDYAIGDEYRYDACAQTLMNAAASSFETTEIKEGVAYAELRYVPAMVGKTVFIYANAVIDGKHIGISRKVTLKGKGVTTNTLSCDYKITGPNCSMRYKLMLNGPEDTPAQNLYIEQPKLAGDPVYSYATASRTDCDGWTTVTIHGIDVNKTASVSFGDFIADEIIRNQK